MRMPAMVERFIKRRRRTMIGKVAAPTVLAMAAFALATDGPANAAAIVPGVGAPAATTTHPLAAHPSATQRFAQETTPEQNQAINAQLTRDPSGMRISPQALSYDNGNVIYQVAPNSLDDCPGGAFERDWVCLFDGENHQGRMLKFRSPGYLQGLDRYAFDNKTSSWANTRRDRAFLHDYPSGAGWTLCLPPRSNSRSMGDKNNDAGSIYVSTSSRC